MLSLFFGQPAHVPARPDGDRPLAYLDRLRTLAALAVVFLHVTLGMLSGMEPFSRDWWLAEVLCWLSQWSVPVFVMISGALLLDPERNEPPGEFYRKRLRRIGWPLLFWTGFYFLCRRVFDGEPIGGLYVIDHLVAADPPYHTYYLWMILGLYALTPLLRPFVRHAPTSQRRYLMVLALALAAGYHLCDAVFWNNHRFVLTFFLSYLGYYLAGVEIRRDGLSFVPRRLWPPLLGLAALATWALWPTVLETEGRLQGRFVVGFFSVPVILLSLAVFAAARRLGGPGPRPLAWLNRLLERLAPLTFGVYLVHVFLLLVLRTVAPDEAGSVHFLPVALVVTVGVFAASTALTAGLRRVGLLQRLV